MDLRTRPTARTRAPPVTHHYHSQPNHPSKTRNKNRKKSSSQPAQPERVQPGTAQAGSLLSSLKSSPSLVLHCTNPARNHAQFPFCFLHFLLINRRTASSRGASGRDGGRTADGGRCCAEEAGMATGTASGRGISWRTGARLGPPGSGSRR